MKVIQSNIHILITITIINFIVLFNFIFNGHALHGIGYFIFFYVAIFLIHSFTEKIPPKNEILVKETKKELIAVICFAVLSLLFLALNFLLKSGAFPNTSFTKISIGIGSILFVMPFGTLVYFLIKRYKLPQLGFITKPISSVLIGIVIWGITGLFAYIFNKQGMLWGQVYEEFGGFVGLIVQGVIGAALFEEFSRFCIQSRFERLYNTNGINILFATTIWAFMHFPVTYFKGATISDTLFYCIQIIPLGCIWGYLTQRTKSILPATIAHGFNLWGFQNS